MTRWPTLKPQSGFSSLPSDSMTPATSNPGNNAPSRTPWCACGLCWIATDVWCSWTGTLSGPSSVMLEKLPLCICFASSESDVVMSPVSDSWLLIDEIDHAPAYTTRIRAPWGGVSGTGTTRFSTQSFSFGAGVSIDTWRISLLMAAFLRRVAVSNDIERLDMGGETEESPPLLIPQATHSIMMLF
uniref:Uncharacterized protein n=1 Tax=Anopheles atroparvus TaxID=41427 RepID=A0A182JHP8_ANOAO